MKFDTGSSQAVIGGGGGGTNYAVKEYTKGSTILPGDEDLFVMPGGDPQAGFDYTTVERYEWTNVPETKATSYITLSAWEAKQNPVFSVRYFEDEGNYVQDIADGDVFGIVVGAATTISHWAVFRTAPTPGNEAFEVEIGANVGDTIANLYTHIQDGTTNLGAFFDVTSNTHTDNVPGSNGGEFTLTIKDGTAYEGLDGTGVKVVLGLGLSFNGSGNPSDYTAGDGSAEWESDFTPQFADRITLFGNLSSWTIRAGVDVAATSDLVAAANNIATEITNNTDFQAQHSSGENGFLLAAASDGAESNNDNGTYVYYNGAVFGEVSEDISFSGGYDAGSFPLYPILGIIAEVDAVNDTVKVITPTDFVTVVANSEPQEIRGGDLVLPSNTPGEKGVVSAVSTLTDGIPDALANITRFVGVCTSLQGDGTGFGSGEDVAVSRVDVSYDTEL